MTTWARRNVPDLRWAVAIFALAFGVRLGVLLWLRPEPLHAISDAWFYRFAGEDLAHGRGYMFHGHGSAPTAFWPPAFSAILAAVYLLPGPDLIAGNVLNVTVSATGSVVVFLIGRRLWDRAVGVAGGILFALFPSNVLFSSLVLTECLFATLLACIVLLFVNCCMGLVSSRGPALILGLICGAAALLRGEGVFLLPTFALILWATSRSLPRAITFALPAAIGMAAILGIWTVRNAIQLDAPIPVSTSGGIVAAIGHWEHADGGDNRARTKQVNRYYEGDPFPDREVKAASKQTKDALRYAVTHPLRELELIPLRLWHLYRDDHAAVHWARTSEVHWSDATATRASWYLDTYYYAVLALAVVGAVRWISHSREAAIALLGVVAAISSAFGVFFFGDPRFHTSLIPIFSLLAAPALVDVLKALRRALG